jgi:hypothetical protein
MMSTATAVTPQQPPALSQSERVIDTFVAPTKTFTDIRRNASWWLPWLLMSIAGLAMVTVVEKKVGMERVVENQVQTSPKAQARLDQLSPEQRAKQMELSANITRGFSYGSPVMTIIFVAVIAAVLLGTFNFGFGQELRFAQCLAISMYAFLPTIIKALLVIVSILIGGGENFSFQNQLASNLGAFFDPNTSHFLWSVASAIDVFNIWVLVLTGIGYSCVTRLKRGTCMGVVFGWWAVVTLVGAAVGSLFG